MIVFDKFNEHLALRIPNINELEERKVMLSLYILLHNYLHDSIDLLLIHAVVYHYMMVDQYYQNHVYRYLSLQQMPLADIAMLTGIAAPLVRVAGYFLQSVQINFRVDSSGKIHHGPGFFYQLAGIDKDQAAPEKDNNENGIVDLWMRIAGYGHLNRVKKNCGASKQQNKRQRYKNVVNFELFKHNTLSLRFICWQKAGQTPQTTGIKSLIGTKRPITKFQQRRKDVRQNRSLTNGNINACSHARHQHTRLAGT